MKSQDQLKIEIKLAPSASSLFLVILAKARIQQTRISKMAYYVYILCSKTNGTLYIGVTNDLRRRMYERKNKLIKGFTEKYNVNRLVYMETYQDIREAIHREKCLKHWNRGWKLKLISKANPEWKDLHETL